MKKKKSSLRFKTPYAVSEVLGTVILIIIAVSAGTAFTVIILNPWLNYFDSTLPYVSLVGSTDGDTVVFEHRGGIALSDETMIRITIAGTDYTIQAEAPYLLDINSNGKWDVGEQCRYTYAGPLGLADKEVRAVIVQSVSNIVILDKLLQEGFIDDSMVIAIDPYTIPNGVSETSAILKLYYNFIEDSYHAVGFVNFSLYPSVTPANITWSAPIRPPAISGWYAIPVTGLTSGVEYTFSAHIYYKQNGINKTNTSTRTFWTYSDIRGLWHFDEPAGSLITVDSSIPAVNGTVSAATFSTSGHLNNALRLDAADEQVIINHHQKFNTTSACTFRTWINLGMQSDTVAGDIDYIDSSDFVDDLGIRCFEPDVIHINNDIYCVACRTELNASVITIKIDDSGSLQSVVDTVFFDIPFFYEPDIIHITNTIYAITFGAETTQFNASGYILTLTIDNTGDISDSVLDALDFTQFFGTQPCILHVANSIYAISYGGGASPALNISTGYIVTISIASNGQISNAVIDTFKFNISFCLETGFIHITNDIFAVTYGEDDSTNGYLLTISIDQTGDIQDTIIDDLMFVINDDMQPCITQVNADYYVVCFGGNLNNDEEQGFLFSVSINNTGAISAIIDSQPTSTQFCMAPTVIPVSQNIIGIVYSGGFIGMKGRTYIESYQLFDDGQISDTILDSYQFIGKNGSSTAFSTLNNQDTRFVVLYATNSIYHGAVGTVEIARSDTQRNIIAKNGMFSVTKSRYNLTVTLVIGGILHSVTATLSDGWNHVVITYDGVELRVYINTTLLGQISCSGPITSTITPITVGGGMIGRIDEIIFFSSPKDVVWINTDYIT